MAGWEPGHASPADSGSRGALRALSRALCPEQQSMNLETTTPARPAQLPLPSCLLLASSADAHIPLLHAPVSEESLCASAGVGGGQGAEEKGEGLRCVHVMGVLGRVTVMVGEAQGIRFIKDYQGPESSEQGPLTTLMGFPTADARNGPTGHAKWFRPSVAFRNITN